MTALKQLFHPKQPLFTKLRVIHQILIIISVMALFSLLQGVLGIQLIKTMQKTNADIFAVSNQDSYNIGAAKQDLQQLSINYLGHLAGQSMFVASPESVNRTASRLIYLKKNHPRLVNSILENLAETRKIIELPINLANYQQLDKNLRYISDYLSMLDNDVRNNAEATMANSETFSFQAQLYTLILLLLSILVSVGLGLLVDALISRPLKNLLQITKSLAIGDLSKNAHANGCAEIIDMATGLNQAISGIQAHIKTIGERADILSQASEELRKASSDTGQASTQVAIAMEELAKASSEQTDQINQAVVIINNLSELVKKASGDTENLSQVSERVANSAMLGQKASSDIASEITELFNSTTEVAMVINDLNTTSQEISEITSMIGGIAEQTALLALNAAIEAARAGEHGKGFAVVAQETGKLAEQSKQAAQLISTLTLQMNTKIEHAVSAMQKGMAKVEKGTNMITQTSSTFGEIFAALKNNLIQIEAVAKSNQEMAASNTGVIAAINSIASISEESMASTEEISATAEEQNASMEEVTALADNLSQIANELRKSIAVFKV